MQLQDKGAYNYEDVHLKQGNALFNMTIDIIDIIDDLGAGGRG